MKYDRFTVKSREALLEAQNLAGKQGNPELRPHHLKREQSLQLH